MTFRPIQDVPVSLGNLQDEMNRLFDRVWHGGISTPPFDGQKHAPPVDLIEYSDRYVLLVEIPGVDAEEIEVTCIGQTVSIRGEKVKPAEPEAGQRISTERRFGTFCRTVELACEVDSDGLAARCQAGVLEISVPKTESSKPKSVKIEVAGG